MARLRRLYKIVACVTACAVLLLVICAFALTYAHQWERRKSLDGLLSNLHWHDHSPQSHTFFLGGGESIVIRNDTPEAKQTGGFVVFPGGRLVNSKEEALDWLMSLDKLESGQVEEFHDGDYDG